MKRTLLILLILFIGCNSKEKIDIPKIDSDYIMYGLMIEKFSSSTHLIEEEMYSTINDNDLSKIKDAELYDSLTVEYKKYLETVFQKILDEATSDSDMDYNGSLSNHTITNRIFFNENSPSDFGVEYLKKQNEYRKAILNFIQRKNLMYRVNQTLNTDNATDRNGEKIEYLNYYFKDIPPIAIMTHIKFIENSIVGFENEHFKNLAIGK